MKALVALIAATVAIVCVNAAHAAPVRVGAVTYSPEFQEKLRKTYGEREGALLSEDIARALNRELAGLSVPTETIVDVEIVDAKPNRPTFKELSDRVGLSLQSVGIGGATLKATMRTANGASRTVDYSWYEHDIRDTVGSTTWTDANRAIRWFADQVAEVAAEPNAASGR